MAERDVVVRIRAEIGAFKRDMAAAANAAKKTAEQTEAAGKQSESAIGRLAQTAQTHDKAWNQVSTGMVASGAAIVGALALSTKAAMDWESAWAGVTKTVDGSPQQMAQLEGELRNLARTLPSTHTEIAAVAEAAGQLGVARKDVSGFTKTMIDLGESTNLTAEDAATNIAQISNVMGTMEREGSKGVERFGSALVALGNDGASTESDILSMAQRIAGAGATLGASEADVLALSNTLASMGVRAELGGGVTTRVLLKMRSAVDEGGDSLASFAEIAGVSADEFATKFREAPVEALDMVSKGIYGVNEAGGNVTQTLKDLGIKGTEETQVMLALANSGDLLTDSLNLGAEAWANNTALVEEANKRYETAESKVKIAWNNIKDAAIDAGAVILPAVSGIAGVVADLAGGFADLPDPVKTALTVLGGVGGVGLLATGGMMKLVSALGDTIPKMQALGIDTPRATKAVGLLGKSLGAVTAVGAGFLIGKTVIEGINDAVRSGKPDVEAYFNLIATGGNVKDVLNLGESDGWSGSIFKDSGEAAKEYYDTLTVESGNAKRAIEQLANTDGLTGLTGWFSKNLSFGDVRGATEDALQLQEAMRGIARAFDMGESELGIDALKGLQSELELTDSNVATLINSTPELKSALTNLATENGIQIDPNNELGLVDLALGRIQTAAPGAAEGLSGVDGALGDTAVSAEDAAKAVDDFYQAMVNAGMVVLNEREALRGMQESFDAATASIEENGRTLDITTEKGRANQAALDGIASSTLAAMEAQREAGATAGELGETISTGREAFITNAEAMGMSSEKAAALADSLNLIPGAVYINFDSNTDDIGAKLIEIHELVQATPDGRIQIDENSPQVIAALEEMGYKVTTLPDGRIEVTDNGTAAVTGKKADAVANKYREALIKAQATNTGATESALDAAAAARVATITANPIVGGAIAALDAAARDRYSTIHTRVVVSGSQTSTGRGGRGGLTTGGYTGGLVGRLINGAAGGGLVPGQIPLNSQGDNVLAMVNGKPFGLRSGEMVVNEKATRENLPLLQAINGGATIQLPGFASGGRVGAAQSKVDRLQRQYSRMSSSKANRNRKLDLKDDLDAAKKELAAAKASAKAAEKSAKEAQKKAAEARKEERERQGRLSEARFDLRRDLKRGEITDSLTSGSGMSVVDRLFEQSNNKDLSRGKRSSLRATAYGVESQLLSLEKRSESLKTKLEKATEARDRLLEVSKSVASGLRGEYSLGGVLSNLLSGEQKGPLAASSFVKSAQGKAAQIKRFGVMLGKLRKKGYNDAIIQEIADLGTTEGTQVGNALLGATGKERDQLNNAYKSMDYWSGQAGVEVTRSMERGGIDAAEGLVRGLEGKTEDVEDAFYKLGKSAEKAFRKSLDMHSPSKTMAIGGVDSVDGVIVGAESKRQQLINTYASLGDDVASAYQPALAYTVPSSVEVSRYAQAQAAPASVSPEAIALAVQAGMAGWQPIVNIDGRQFYGTMQQVNQQYGNRR
ncbi:phage tail tape measure protein [Glutamicibacter sp. FBE19]|uniref:phage tail tape measure protein n=1 Tax=Glutamicibacter sp. FBE19 TaxID=2761534 RepID=UPI00189699C8|nr:phage tail tape measure protein [Glutamicibacter sp. FBE19]